MFSMLLVIIYIAFISLGLPDSLLGSTWPQMQPVFEVSLSYAGIISMIIAVGTVISSLLSERVICKLGTGKVTAVSVLMTAVALFGFSVSGNFVMLCLFAVPYGLGAGAVDAALNNFVALHYSSKHMSWLHCFWGVGASVGPYIMGSFIATKYGWRGGYGAISVIQIVLTCIIFSTLFLWKENNNDREQYTERRKAKNFKEIVQVKGIYNILFAFFCYSAVEQTTGLWAASYLVINREMESNIAAKFASLFYIGITVGRGISGFVANKIGDKNMIRIGIGIILAGIGMIIFPINVSAVTLVGFIAIGLGCAPIYPSIIHATPDNFGKENSQAVIGVQMASAYIGTSFMPPLFGIIAQHINIALFPLYLLIFTIIMLVATEKLNRMNR